ESVVAGTLLQFVPLTTSDAQILRSIRSREARIAVLGMGHVGLPTALSLAAMGWNVLGADALPSVIEKLKAGHAPFYEPGLEELLREHLGKRFFPLDDMERVIREATVIFLCVGTPQKSSG